MDERDSERTPYDAAREFASSDLGKSMIAGAAVGAEAAAILPFVGWGFGAVVGAGYGAYRKLRK